MEDVFAPTRETIKEKRFSSALENLSLPLNTVELFGHVTLVEGYDVQNYKGCHALVSLRDKPNTTVALLTTSLTIQPLLETALATGKLIAFRGSLLTNPPTPLGGTWAVPVYGNIVSVILYNFN
jgi:hypothetical protein